LVKLLSTRARAQLWKLQEAVRATSRDRDRWLRLLNSGRAVLAPSAHRDLWMEFSCADQEYQHAVARLADFVRGHGDPPDVGLSLVEPEGQ
jgi:hypothetical protein